MLGQTGYAHLVTYVALNLAHNSPGRPNSKFLSNFLNAGTQISSYLGLTAVKLWLELQRRVQQLIAHSNREG